MPAIECTGLTKTYSVGLKKHVALDHLDFQVQEGEVFGFLGPNGAGKTTTIKLLLGLIQPTSGAATIFGHPSHTATARARVGFLPESPYFYDHLTATEFLAFCGRLFGLTSVAIHDATLRLLKQVGLEEAAHTPLRKFSKGMLQRIGIAQALINDPQLVILDEPMSGLDPIGRKDCRDLILQLKQAGKTICFSSHIIPDVEMICDHIAILVKGKLIRMGRVEEILDAHQETLEALFIRETQT